MASESVLTHFCESYGSMTRSQWRVIREYRLVMH